MTEDMMRNSTKIVNMGCMDKDWCPTVFLNNLVDWGIEDPKGKSIEKVTEIRDQIEQRLVSAEIIIKAGLSAASQLVSPRTGESCCGDV